MGNVKFHHIGDIEEFEKIPIEERLDVFNTYDLIKKGAAINPDATAISFFLSGDSYDQPMQVTYRDLMSNITKTANLFHDLEIGPQDVISYLLPNLPHTHYVLWGGEAAGIVNPINPLLEPGTIAEICQAAGTKVLVALAEYPDSDIWQKAMAVRKELPDLKAVIRVMGPSDENDGIYGYDDLISRYNGERLDSNREISPQDIASMYHTGGTTGTPKLAPHNHFNETVMALMIGAAAELNTREAALCGLPLFHVNGTTVTGSMPFSIGAHVVLLGPRGYRDPSVMQNFFKIVDHYKAVTFSSVPTVLSVLLDIPKGEADISSLRYAICGAAPLSVELFKRFEEHSGMKILEGYGLTEGTCASSFNPYHGQQKVGSIGLRLPYMQMKTFIVDGEGKFVREAAIDEIGAVCIKGPNVFDGYLDDAHNQGIWPKEGWLNTGDLGRQGADGFFWLTGRTKELIIRGGHNIDPAAIEDPLYRLPGVQVAAAVGRPDPHAGEVPIAYVQLQEGADLSESQIIDYLRKEVGERAAIPKEVFIVDQIPLTPVGKIFKPSLRWQAIQRVFEIELNALGDLTESIEIKVKEDKIHGSTAEIKLKAAPGVAADAIKQKAEDILARYTIKYLLEIT
ncbi:AMP-binding protein [Alkalispirochaeta odontotermitis]|nr:AMP-binding protein [Alkalispirochaeta odontotermitis]CAB1080001.1 Long-chain-fatty-acid--CoA ligase (EC [Olavius algarvensis Delta 1 endosymbiont]